MRYLQADNLCHRFADGSVALDQVSITVAAGELIVIAGANGSGKTTLLKHLNGLLLPQSGQVILDDVPIVDDLRETRSKVGMVFQDPDSQIIGDTVYDDIAFGPENLRLSSQEVKRRVTKAMAEVGLTGFENKIPQNLSGGEKRLVAIAGVLAMDPAVLLMDEPFSNLDYGSARSVLTQIRRLHANGHAIIITTHDLEKVLGYADRLVVMRGGKIAADGQPSEIVTTIESYGVRPPCSVLMNGVIEPWLG
ncbi:MAG: ABC transporter ATP-binding protein [Desulfobulbaceae bacterium]|nr:MAG: ABC transporter ATP-binding protein [Desulfobulbaceae bacterium]